MEATAINDWTLYTIIKAYNESGFTYDINDGIITGIRFEGRDNE